MSKEAAPAGPTPAAERLDIVDVLRGFALSGVLLVNFAEMVKDTSGVDHATRRLIEVFATGSFYPLFAMLFGMGFVLQFARWEARRAPALRLYLRRVAGLFLFGLAVWCLLAPWWILLQYAVAGLALLPFRRVRTRTLLVAAGTVYALTSVVIPEIRLATGIQAAALAPPEQMRANQQRIGRLTREGSYPALVVARARTIALFLSRPPWYLSLGLQPLALFLLGAGIARSRILEDPTRYRARLPRLIVWGALLGLTANLIVLLRPEGGMEGSGVSGRLTNAGLDLGDTALAFAYAATVVFLYSGPGAWRRRLAPLALGGRTALSNVVLQWMVISTLLFGYGFGLQNRLGALTCLLLCMPIFAAELWLSRRWLLRHRFGPLEWLWRTMTYGHPPRGTDTAVRGALYSRK